MIKRIDNKKIYFTDKGRGKVLLLVHGWGGSSESLQALSQLLQTRHRVILVDLPGFGKSDDPAKDWGIEEYGKILANFLSELQLDKIIYVGHSFGGALGVFLAANYPQMIEKLVVCSASYKREKKPSGLSSYFNFLPPVFKKPIYRILFPHSDLFKVPRLEANFRKIVNQDLTPLLPKIVCPTLILWGKEDSETPYSHGLELEQKIKNSKLISYEDVRHALPIRHPELVFDQIIKFV